MMKIALQFRIPAKYFSDVEFFLVNLNFSFAHKKIGNKWLFHVKDVEDSEDFKTINEYLSVLIPAKNQV